jgi:hypothetical protein
MGLLEKTRSRRQSRQSSYLLRGPVGTINVMQPSFTVRIAFLFLLLLGLLPSLSFTDCCVADDATTQPTYDWKSLDGIIGVKGELKDDVYSYTLPRNDLNVSIDSMDVPAAAGIASQFYFYRCSCGKIRLVGQFCCADYEANDVIDALRVGAMIQVAGSGPMFLDDKPRITIVRFQGEGDASALAHLLKSALSWIGDARTATRPLR